MSLQQRLRDIYNSLVTPAAHAAPVPARAMATVMLMLEVAWADHDISSHELMQMKLALQRLHGMAPAEADELIAQARRDHAAATSVQPFTRALNEQLSMAEKFEVVTEMWRLALSDAVLDKYEEYHVRRIAELLYVPHADFIAAKLIAKQAAPPR